MSAGRTTILLLALSSTVSSLGEAPASAKIDNLLRGVTINEELRFRVADIRVGATSVLALFERIQWQEPSAWQWYRAARGDVTLRLRKERVAELNQFLVAREAMALTVVMLDELDVLPKKLPGLRDPAFYRREIRIEVVAPALPCQEVQRIVYETINEHIREEMQQGQADRRINLNALFDLLLTEKIGPFMKRLPPIRKSDPCFSTFELMKWLDADETSGFASGEYRLHEGLRDLIDPTIETLNKIQTQWERRRLSLRVLGHADAEQILAQIALRKDATGIDEWRHAPGKLDVWYRGCAGDFLTGTEPVYLDMHERQGTRVPDEIGSNCELAAVRAYTAALYFMNGLEWRDVDYSYATGGVRPARQNEAKDAPRRRAVEIEIVVKAARSADRSP